VRAAVVHLRQEARARDLAEAERAQHGVDGAVLGMAAQPAQRPALAQVGHQDGRGVHLQIAHHGVQEQVVEALQIELAREAARHAVQDRELVQQRLALALERVGLDAAPQRDAHLLGRPRLGDEAVDRSFVDRALEGLGVAVRGHHDADRLRVDPRDAREELGAGHFRHAVIGEHQGDGLALEDLEALFAAARREDRELAAEGELEDPQVLRLVVDVEDRVLAVVVKELRLRPHHPALPRTAAAAARCARRFLARARTRARCGRRARARCAG